jgi:hypothetical protein
MYCLERAQVAVDQVFGYLSPGKVLPNLSKYEQIR